MNEQIVWGIKCPHCDCGSLLERNDGQLCVFSTYKEAKEVVESFVGFGDDMVVPDQSHIVKVTLQHG